MREPQRRTAWRLQAAPAGYVYFSPWKRCAHDLLSRALFATAESTITDGLSDRSKPRDISYLECPGERADGPTPGTVRSRLILPARKRSRCSELTRAYSVFCRRTMLSRLTRSRGRRLSLISSFVASSSGEIPEPPLSWFEPLAFDSRRSLLLLFAERGNDHCADHAAPLVIGFYFSSGGRSFRKETYKSKS